MIIFSLDKEIYQGLNFSVISTQNQGREACGFPLIFIVFTFSLAEIRLCRTVVRRRNGYSTTLRIFICLVTRDAKKVQTENRTNNKTFTKHNKVFARLFSKGGAVKNAEFLSRSAEREISARRFLFYSIFFCACICKRKSG